MQNLFCQGYCSYIIKLLEISGLPRSQLGWMFIPTQHNHDTIYIDIHGRVNTQNTGGRGITQSSYTALVT